MTLKIIRIFLHTINTKIIFQDHNFDTIRYSIKSTTSPWLHNQLRKKENNTTNLVKK